MYSNPFAGYSMQPASPSAPFYSTSYNRPAPVYNPAGQVTNNGNQAIVLPPQQILQVNGKAGVDMLRMSPNSSVIALDLTAPIGWICVSDGVGYVTATPFDMSPHTEKPAQTEASADQFTVLGDRLTALESKYEQIAGRIKANEPNAYSGKSE